MTLIKLGKNFLKITGIITGSLIILLALFYWWFIHHAERAIEDIVYLQSQGKLKVEIGKIKYNYGRKLSIQNITFYTADTAGEKMGYNFQIRQLHLTVRSVRSLIFDKQLLIDSIVVQSPNISITRLQKSEERHMSLPEEMGKIYQSIEKALQVLEISRFQIDNAQFNLIDKTAPQLQPLTIGRLHFHIDNFKVDTSQHKQRDKFLFSDNVVLSSDHQAFMLPDGNHHIAYRNFNINIRKKLVELDSCTITAYKHHGTIPVFKMFVDTMLLTNVDFLALSRQGLIRADSVYLVNSDIRLNIEEDSIARRKKNRKPFNFQEALTGIASDMQLAYIGVKNSSVNVTTTKGQRTNTFSSSRNNFELYNVKVDTRAEQPISIEQFLMAIRNYDGYGKDSAYRLQFDSIRFTNNTVRLDNFSITTTPGARVPVIRNYRIPLFELKGLSWQDLLFNRHIAAREAVLHQPVLQYEKLPWKDTADRRSIYQLFTVLDTIINLRRISMVDGQLDFKLNSNTRIVLNNVNGSVNTDRLLSATSSGFIESSVESLAFSKGNITTKQLLIDMDRAYFEGGSRSLVIRKFNLRHKEQAIRLSADDLAFQDLLLNDSIHLLRIDHISWKKAAVDIEMKRSQNDSTATPLPLKLFVNGIQLNNTNINFKREHQILKTFIRQASAGSIIKDPGEPLQLTQLHLKGGPLNFVEPGTTIGISGYDIHEGRISSLEDILVRHYQNKDSIHLDAKALSFTPYIETASKGPLRIDNIVMTEPELAITTYPHAHPALHKKQYWPELELSSFRMVRPSLNIKEHKDSGLLQIYMEPGRKTDGLTLTNIRVHHTPHNQLTAATVQWQSSRLMITETGQDSSLLAAGALAINFKDLILQRTNALSATAILQHAVVYDFENSGRNNGNITRADSLCLENLHFNSAWLKEPEQFFRNSPAMSLHHFTGHHTTKTNHFTWQNLRYSNKQKELSLDSFSYTPVAGRDEYIAAHPFQTDYIQARTGAIKIRDIEPRLYFNDSVLTVSTLSIQHPYIEVYRDKRPPFQHGIYKPLPTALIRKIPFQFSIDTVQVQNLTAQYSELSAKTHQTGVVLFTQIDASLYPVRNVNLGNTDSLRLTASALFMDKTGIKLTMNESYTDSLQGFFLNVHMSPTNLPMLNSILEPLASIKVRNGELDTMVLRAVGRDYISFGEMQMKYRDLNIQFLKNGIDEKTTFVTRFITWAANHLVLRKHNANKTGTVYFPRFRDRSIFNYWVKMTLSGAASSVGVKKNRKLLKRYHKALRKNELPPIQYFE